MVEDAFGIVGSVIAGTYSVVEVVAEGGFGVVYRAHHGGFRAPVAMKLLKVPQQSAEQRADFLELFRAEAELLFRLSASLPTVVRPLHVDAFQTADGRFVPYIVMEWLDGMTLDALIQARNRDGQPPVPLRKLVRLLTPVARALERAHNFSGPEGAISIVHRDLKPENIFIAQVDGEEIVKILDFGIGKVRSAASQVAGRLSQDGKAPTAFTPAYGAPEQWAPRHYGQTGPWTDVWGLALCIVETLAARPIIDGDSPTMMGITLDAKRRPTPRKEGVDVSDAVEDVFERALALDPRARQRDVGVFWNELIAALQVSDAERAPAPPRDERVEDSRAPRIELVNLPSRAPVGSRAASVSPAAVRAEEPTTDLEFDLLSASNSQRNTGAARVTSTAPRAGYFVPDLELQAPSPARRASGERPMAQPPNPQPSVLDLEDAPSALQALDLDLPADEPVARRAVSSARFAAVQIPAQRSSVPPPARSLSGSMTTVRDSIPPVSSPVLPNAPRASRPPPSPMPNQHDAGSMAKLDTSTDRSLMHRLKIALALLGTAVVIAAIDPIYAAVTGEVLQVLGQRLSVFGGLLLLLALGLGVREALRES